MGTKSPLPAGVAVSLPGSFAGTFAGSFAGVFAVGSPVPVSAGSDFLHEQTKHKDTKSIAKTQIFTFEFKPFLIISF
jgi:hypothetical protein